MNIIVHKNHSLSGAVVVPSSKSHSVRALLLATLAKGKSELENVLDADDTIVARAVCQALGARLAVIKRTDDSGGLDIVVESIGAPVTLNRKIFTGNSGITTRFVLPLLGLRKNQGELVELDCGEQMRARPILPLLQSLRDLGMKIEETSDTVYPLKISGSLRGGTTTIDGTTSQYLSALLLALPLAEKDSEIIVEKLNERPYAEMTTRWLEEQGMRYTWEKSPERDVISITGRQKYSSFKKMIPGDWSSASYLIAAGVLIPGEVRIEGLDFDDPQGDKRLVEILKAMGADIVEERNELVIRDGKKLRGTKIDCNDIPDLVPTLAVVATQAKGVTELVNVAQARLKEIDRLHSMANGLTKMGARVEEKLDGLIIHGGNLRGAKVKGYGDHRTVMALALAGFVAERETIIDTAEAVNKTFPGFFETMRRLGVKMELG